MAKGKASGADAGKVKGLGKGDKVKVIGGEHEGKAGELEHQRAATATATVRFANGDAASVKLTDLAAA